MMEFTMIKIGGTIRHQTNKKNVSLWDILLKKTPHLRNNENISDIIFEKKKLINALQRACLHWRKVADPNILLIYSTSNIF
jgi:hypothetical protein